MPNSLAVNRFRKLVDDISTLYLTARKVQVEFAWTTGRRIVEEEQNGQMRAQYGTSLIPKLSEALTKKSGPGFSERTLRNMRQLYLLYPIRQVPAELDWTDYVELMPVEDTRTRKRLQQRVIRENLNSAQIRELVQKIRDGKKKPSSKLSPLKRPTDLKLNTFSKSPLKVKLPDNQVLLDCGFFVSWPVSKEDLAGLNVLEQPLYTYAATIDRVIDGDTLLVLIEVGFGIIVRDKLRLRGIDTPELGTPEGDKAKKFLEGILPSGSTIVLKSHKCKTDNYGRFVADVFYKEGTLYLNQQLLDESYAVRAAE